MIGLAIQVVNNAGIVFNNALLSRVQPDMPFWKRLVRSLPSLIFVVVWLALTFRLISVYSDLVKSEGSEITIAFLGAVFVKTLVFPAIKALVTGKVVKWLLRWIRDGGSKPPPQS